MDSVYSTIIHHFYLKLQVGKMKSGASHEQFKCGCFFEYFALYAAEGIVLNLNSCEIKTPTNVPPTTTLIFVSASIFLRLKLF